MDYEILNTPSIDSDYIPPTTTPSVPPDYLIQSGGGISNMHHGHPQGPYSETATRSDIYGYSEPFQQTGFMQAVRGDMYDGTGIEKMVPRTRSELGMNQMPAYATQQGANIDYPYAYGPQVIYDSKKNDDNTTENYELLEPYVTVLPNNNNSKKKFWTQVTIFLVLLLIFLVFDLWIQSGNSLIRTYIYRSGSPSLKQMLIISSVFTVILILVSTWIDIPLVRFEHGQGY